MVIAFFPYCIAEQPLVTAIENDIQLLPVAPKHYIFL